MLILPVVCRLPWEHSTCVNSVYQALFPPPAHKNLGTRICDHLTSSMTCCYGDAEKEVYTTLIIDEELISLELYLKKVPYFSLTSGFRAPGQC